MLTIGFGTLSEESRSRIPNPPQKSTTFMIGPPVPPLARLSHRPYPDVGHFRSPRQTEGTDDDRRDILGLQELVRMVRAAFDLMNVGLHRGGRAAKKHAQHAHAL